MPTVLITGANRGLGLEFARQYVRDGWQVIATCRNAAHADALRALGAAVRIEQLELSDLAAIGAVGRELKHETIDVLRCSRPTLERIIQRGELAVVRVSERTVRISESAVRDFLAQRERDDRGGW